MELERTNNVPDNNRCLEALHKRAHISGELLVDLGRI